MLCLATMSAGIVQLGHRAEQAPAAVRGTGASPAVAVASAVPLPAPARPVRPRPAPTPAPATAGTAPPSDRGVASWFKAAAGTCAHRSLPMGTLVTVTRADNGASATCRVNDRGPTLATGRLVDLSVDVFEKLSAREAGLVDITIRW